MPHPVPDLTMRTLVAELAGLHPEDAAAILSNLNDEERRVIEGYLHEHLGRFELAVVPSGGVASFDVSRISGWLAAYLQARLSQEDVMTAYARASLQANAVRLFPVGGRAL